jgi:hypothetical protein
MSTAITPAGGGGEGSVSHEAAASDGRGSGGAHRAPREHRRAAHTHKDPQLTGAAHARQVVVDRVGAHFEVVHDGRAQGGRGVEEAAVDDDDLDLARLHAGLVEKVADRGEADLCLGGGGGGGVWDGRDGLTPRAAAPQETPPAASSAAAAGGGCFSYVRPPPPLPLPLPHSSPAARTCSNSQRALAIVGTGLSRSAMPWGGGGGGSTSGRGFASEGGLSKRQSREPAAPPRPPLSRSAGL